MIELDIAQLVAENPTYVGMDRKKIQRVERLYRKPHVCGDGPM